MRYLMLLLLTIPFSGYGSTVDLLAADAASAKYRTEKAHPVIHRVSAVLRQRVFRNPRRYLPDLVRFLTRGSRSPYETVKRLHDWVSYTISYDSDLFLGTGTGGGSRSLYHAIRLKRTTCGGFARIMRKMAELAGFRAEYIVAHSRSYGRYSTGRTANHAWTGVWIRGRLYFVDCSADSRSSFKYGKFSEKRKYKSRNLFIHPKAKIHSNLPHKQRFIQVINPPTYREWIGRLRTTGYYYGFRMRFITDMKRIVRKVRQPREGGKLFSIYDRITMRGSRLVIRFTSARKNIHYRVLLRDENRKYYKAHVMHYSIGNEQVCVVSPPKPGLYTLWLKGGLFGKGMKTHTFYKCRILARLRGTPLPRAIGRLYRNRRMRHYGVKINSLQLKNGICRADISWPEGHSVYATLLGTDGKRAWSKRTRSYLSATRVRWFFTTRGAGPFFFTIRARRVGWHRYHRLVATARVGRTGREPEPLNELIYWKRWHTKRLRLVAENVSRAGRRVYRVRVAVPRGVRMFCTIKKPGRKTRYRKHYLYSRKARVCTFQFTAPGSGRYQGRIYASNAKGGYNTVLSFSFRARRKGSRLPLAGELHRYRWFRESGLRIVKKDFSGKAGYRYLQIRAPRQYRMSCSLYNSAGKRQRGFYLHQQRGSNHHFYFTEPGRGRFVARIYVIRKKKFRRVGLLAFTGKGPGKRLPLPGQLYMYRSFHRNGLRLLSGVNLREGAGQYRIRVMSYRGRRLTCRLLNGRGRVVRGGADTIRRGRRYTFTFRPPESGKYRAKIYLLDSNGRRRTVGYADLLSR